MFALQRSPTQTMHNSTPPQTPLHFLKDQQARVTDSVWRDEQAPCVGACVGELGRGTVHRVPVIQPSHLPTLRARASDRGLVLSTTLPVQAFSGGGGAHYRVRAGFPVEFWRLSCGAGGLGDVVPVESGGAIFGQVHDRLRRCHRRHEGDYRIFFHVGVPR